MFCKKCGNQIPEGAAFCNICGTAIVNYENVSSQQNMASYANQNVHYPVESAKPKKNGVIYLLFTILGIVLGLGIGVLVFFVTRDTGETELSMVTYSNKVEGNGFDTPQEAARTYIEKFSDGNMDELYKCFAIESSVDHYTLNKSIERLQCYQPNMSVKLPVYSNLSRNIAIENKKDEVAKSIFYHYRMLMDWSDDVKSMALTLGNETPEKFIEDNFPNNEYYFADGITIDKVYSENDITYESWHSEAVSKNVERLRIALGAEEIQSVIVVFHTKNGYYAWLAGTAKYDGKWYVENNAALYSSVMGIDYNCSGMVYLGEAYDEKTLLNGYI